MTVGALPDMVVFDGDGERLLVANEGEPLACTSRCRSSAPRSTSTREGSVSVIDVERLLERRRNAVRSIGFADFNAGGTRADELSDDVRIYGPGASVAEDLEPEYITVEGDRAYVSLQENDAVAELDLRRNRVVGRSGPALKDHSVEGQGLDPSDRDAATNGGINIGAVAGRAGCRCRTGSPRSATGAARSWRRPTRATRARTGPATPRRCASSSSSYLLDPTAFPRRGGAQDDAALGV